jgi:hypothetical protein
MKQTPIYLAANAAPSSTYQAFIDVIHQKATDGKTALEDISPAAHNLSINGGTTYAAVLANTGWATVTSAVQGTGKGFSFAAGPSAAWEMGASGGSKSLLFSFRFKTGNTSIPLSGGALCGNSGPGAHGFQFYMSPGGSGKLNFQIYDGTNVYNSGALGAAAQTDGLEHTVIAMVDAVLRKIYIWLDGTIVVNGVSPTANLGATAVNAGYTTAGTFPLSFGHAGNPTGTGNGTWDSNASPASPSISFRAIHYAVMASFPTNYLQIAQWLNEGVNAFDPIPVTLLP